MYYIYSNTKPASHHGARARAQDTMSACNNACWALGELAVKSAPEDLGPYALAVVERLVPILSAPMGSMPRSIIENRRARSPRLGEGGLH